MDYFAKAFFLCSEQEGAELTCTVSIYAQNWINTFILQPEIPPITILYTDEDHL
jgi:hypothetical protein